MGGFILVSLRPVVLASVFVQGCASTCVLCVLEVVGVCVAPHQPVCERLLLSPWICLFYDNSRRRELPTQPSPAKAKLP